MALTKEIIKNNIIRFVSEYDQEGQLKDKWRTPLVGFADANHPDFPKLRELVHPEHEMPWDVLSGAKIVIACFVPFTEKIAGGNAGEGLASSDWALCYEETNAMFPRLNGRIISLLKENGYRAAVSKEASVFDREKITSRWSQRHVARLAGLGTFGLNNMLITEMGCCGRLCTVVTDLDAEPDQPIAEEYCLYKRKGACMACVRRCPTGALTEEGFRRNVCFARCRENAKVYTQFGNSYASAAGREAEDSGSEVCGKCLVKLPCTMKKP
ncbi:Epoxyqueuosine reductase [bioreactor metagenome]|uniref:Epoxyqueuosine reductase n=1 Tax=bioreactor metagenome TaxID=1076179 RepID=A0A644XGR6_9ZZZZ